MSYVHFLGSGKDPSGPENSSLQTSVQRAVGIGGGGLPIIRQPGRRELQQTRTIKRSREGLGNGFNLRDRATNTNRTLSCYARFSARLNEPFSLSIFFCNCRIA